MQDRYYARVQKKAVQLARSFLKKQFEEMRHKAMRRNAYQLKLMSKKEWFRKTWLWVGAGGFLSYAKDEVLNDTVVKSVEELRDQLSHFVDNVDMAIAEYWQEAFQLTV